MQVLRLKIIGMVSVAQLVEHRVVASVVEGSSPFTHPIILYLILKTWTVLQEYRLFLMACNNFRRYEIREKNKMCGFDAKNRWNRQNRRTN